jgi:small subunit ribosomal protein S17
MNDALPKTNRKELIGTVVGVGLPKTIKVKVTHVFRHPLYKKAVVKSKRLAVHSELEGIVIGDIVRITETKPISKTKHFKVLGKVTKT